MHKVMIGERLVGNGQPPFFVAELGICHGGSLKTALELTEIAAKAGADCVKTETFQREAMVFDPSAECSHTINGVRQTVPLAEHMDKYGLSFEEHHAIKKRCDELGLPFMTTVHDAKAVDFARDIGTSCLKISSPDIIHYPLLRYAARAGLPICLDTGGALQYEVEIAVRELRGQGLEDIIVNHNPDGHPAPAARHDLRIIPRLKSILGVPMGLADHYEGYEMLPLAVAVGADLLEKPISMDRFVSEPERNYSISAADLPQVIKIVRDAYDALGSAERTISKEAGQYRDRNRMACAAARDLEAGEKICLENVAFGRPRRGIGAEHWDLIEGRSLRGPKKKYEFIQWEDLA